MFFKQQSIEKHLVCKACELMFEDPRVLPCGHSFCNNCIASRVNKKTNNVECPTCKAKHAYQSTGFPVNQLGIELLKEKAKEVNQWQRVKELRQKLDMIDKQCNMLEKSRRAGGSEIKEHCQALRTKVDLNVEVKIEEIRRIGQEFKNKIDNYEKECSTLYSAVSDTDKQEFDSFFVKMREFCLSTRDMLSQYDLIDTEVEQLAEQSTQNLGLIDTKDRILERTKFNSKLLLFESPESKLSSSDVGSLRYKSLGIEIGSINKISLPLQTYIDVSYSEATKCFYSVYQHCGVFQIAKCSISRPQHENYLAISLYHNYSDSYSGSFLCFQETSNGWIFGLRSEISDYQMHRRRSYNEYQYEEEYQYDYRDEYQNQNIEGDNLNQHLTLYIQNQVFTVNIGLKTVLIRFNQNLHYSTHVALTEDLYHFTANSSRIFCLNGRQIVSYTTDLVSSPINLTENIPERIAEMQANETDLFIVHNESGVPRLRVLDISKKKAQREIELDNFYFTNLKLLSTKHLAVFDSQSNRFYFYDQKHISDSSNKHELQVSLEQNLGLVKGNSDIIHLFNSRGEIHYFDLKNI